MRSLGLGLKSQGLDVSKDIHKCHKSICKKQPNKNLSHVQIQYITSGLRKTNKYSEAQVGIASECFEFKTLPRPALCPETRLNIDADLEMISLGTLQSTYTRLLIENYVHLDELRPLMLKYYVGNIFKPYTRFNVSCIYWLNNKVK